MNSLAVLIICLAVLALLITLGVLEKRQNERKLKRLHLRINVNGIRGKSTATRLITGILWEAGYRAVGKTTGTSARIMYWNTVEEKEVKRPPSGINISEQIQIIREAASCRANSLVCECMAVRPEYQRIYQHQIIKSDVTVITNVTEDHLEEMGPTTEQIAWAMAGTIPYHGIAVVPDCEYTDLFKQVARERETKIRVIDDSAISDDYLSQFDYQLFPHNCAVGLAVARALDIPDDVAFRGMLNAHPDPGALRYYRLKGENGPFVLVNAFAANEPSSTLEIWNMIREEEPTLSEKPIIIMNCRPDRVDRTEQFIREFFRKIPNAILVAVGEGTNRITTAYRHKRFPNIVRYYDLDGMEADAVIKKIHHQFSNRLILCVGNIHGIGGIPILTSIVAYGGGQEPKTAETETSSYFFAKPANAKLSAAFFQIIEARKSIAERKKRV